MSELTQAGLSIVLMAILWGFSANSSKKAIDSFTNNSIWDTIILLLSFGVTSYIGYVLVYRIIEFFYLAYIPF